jgi:hypothetical protein
MDNSDFLQQYLEANETGNKGAKMVLLKKLAGQH